jgi:hypothetical protein
LKLRNSEIIKYVIKLSLIICTKRENKNANRVGKDRWLKKAWYIYLQDGELQKTRKNTAKSILKSVQELRIPFCKGKKKILNFRQYYLLLETYECSNSTIRLQIYVQPIKYKGSCSEHINHSTQNTVQLKYITTNTVQYLSRKTKIIQFMLQ